MKRLVLLSMLLGCGARRSADEITAPVATTPDASPDLYLGEGTLKSVGCGQGGYLGPDPPRRRGPGQVTSEPPRVVGAMDPKEVARQVRARLGGLLACYQRVLERDPRAGGRLVVHITFGPAGRANAVSVEHDTLARSELAACVKARAAGWWFPAPRQGHAQVFVPVVFRPIKSRVE